jgi:hypothetical protein
MSAAEAAMVNAAASTPSISRFVVCIELLPWGRRSPWIGPSPMIVCQTGGLQRPRIVGTHCDRLMTPPGQAR